MTVRERLEQYRPTHYHVFLTLRKGCAACQFDEAVNDLIQEVMLSSMAHEREECANIANNKARYASEEATIPCIREIVDEILNRGK